MGNELTWLSVITTACSASAPVHRPEPQVRVDETAIPRPPPTPEATCGRCLGYSPSTGIWLCGNQQSQWGMVGWQGERCALQLLRDERVVAEVVVVAETKTGTQDLDQTLPLSHALRLAPVDLTEVTSLALEPGRELAIPGTAHRLKWEPPDREAVRGARSKIMVLCNRSGPIRGTAVHKSFGSGSGRPAPVVVFWGPWECDLKERYSVEIAPGATSVALIEDSKWGCVDFGIARRLAHPIDLVNACTGSEP
jgi:hypothetical protein